MRTRTLAALGLAAIGVYYVHCRRSGEHRGTAHAAAGAQAPQRELGPEAQALRDALAKAREIHPGAFRIQGSVVDLQSRPLAGATVTLDGSRTTTTDDSGMFELDHLALGDYTLTAEAGDAFAETAYTLAEGAEPVTLVARVGPTVVVHVADRAGAPIAGAALTSFLRVDRQTDETGTATFRGMEPGDTTFYVVAPGFASQNLDIHAGEDPRPRIIEAHVVLVPAAPIGGLVVDQTGKPVPDAHVQAATSAHGWTDSTDTDAQGRWKLAGFGPSKLRLDASSDDFVSVPGPIIALDGSPRLDLVIHVTRGASIDGIVTDAAGKPIAGAHVHAGADRVDTDDHGHFHAPGLDAGEVTVEARTDALGAAPQKLTLALGAHVDVRFALAPSEIAGTVTNQDGTPVANAEVYASGPERHVQHTDALGHFTFGGIAPGDYELTSMRESEALLDDAPSVTARTGRRDVALVLPDVASLEGRVMMNGAPVSFFGVEVSAEHNPRFSRATPVRSEDGRFDRENLAPGTFTVQIVGPSFTPVVIPHVALHPGQATELGDIAVAGGRTLRGRVVDASGMPVAHAAVVTGLAFTIDPEVEIDLSDNLDGERGTHTDAAGHFELAGIAEDATQLEIRAQGPSRGISTPREVTPADFDGEMEIVLAATGGVAGTIENALGGTEYNVRLVSVADRATRFETTTEEGEFTFSQIPAGDYTASLDRDLLTAPVAVHVSAGETARVAFVRPDQTITVDFTIVGASCSGVAVAAPDAVAPLDHSETWIGIARCAGDAAATIANLAPGRYQMCNTQCTIVDVASAPALQHITLNEQPQTAPPDDEGDNDDGDGDEAGGDEAADPPPADDPAPALDDPAPDDPLPAEINAPPPSQDDPSPSPDPTPDPAAPDPAAAADEAAAPAD